MLPNFERRTCKLDFPVFLVPSFQGGTAKSILRNYIFIFAKKIKNKTLPSIFSQNRVKLKELAAIKNPK